MVTSDKDYLQLVSETTEMLNHKNEIVGLSGVQERFGCRPDQVIEVLGLMGDSSDNIPGVRGVGEVPIIPPLAAVSNAVAAATGVRFNALPLSPPAILAGMSGKE